MKTILSISTRLIFLLLLVAISLALIACSQAAPPQEQVVAEATEEPEEAAPATNTPEPPTETPEPPTATPEPPTATPEPPTETPEPPTATPEPPTATPKPPTETPEPPTATPEPPTATPEPKVDPVSERFDQALVYYNQEQWSEAITEFQAVIDLNPAYSPAYVGLGYSYAFNEDFAPAVEALQKYLELEPTAEDRAEVEKDIATLQKILAERGGQEFDIPPGKALFVFKNYSGEQWNVDIGTYFLEVPMNPPDREFTYTTLVIDPGTYTWQAHSADAGNYIVDADGNKGFEFTVAEGEIYATQCCR